MPDFTPYLSLNCPLTAFPKRFWFLVVEVSLSPLIILNFRKPLYFSFLLFLLSMINRGADIYDRFRTEVFVLPRADIFVRSETAWAKVIHTCKARLVTVILEKFIFVSCFYKHPKTGCELFL